MMFSTKKYAALLTLPAASIFGLGLQAATTLPFVEAEGTHFVVDGGKPVQLQGVNLGSWFLLEAWMLGIGDVPDQHSIYRILDRRFGVDQREALIDRHRSTWITEKDFERIRSFGMNCVRLPVHYSMLLDLDKENLLSENGFAWVDRAIEMARSNGLYVILDLHGVPGGQSDDQPSGRVGSNGLWGSEVNKDLTVRIWKAFAERYKNESTIAAYDIINEPYADSPRAPIRDELRQLCERIYHAIRATGDEHVILFPATQMGFFFYQTPEEMDAHNLGFTEHFYNGIFSGEASVDGHARFVSEELKPRRELLKEWQAPYLVGEFNVVHEHSGGDRMMQFYWDLYAEYGWGATMWGYKAIKEAPGVEPTNWYMVTNANELDIPDLRTDDYPTLAAFFDHSDERYVADPDAVTAFRGEFDLEFDLQDYPIPPSRSPEPALAPGWMLSDVGGATPKGSARFLETGEVQLYGGGDDIYEDHDGFAYVYRQLDGDFAFEAEFANFQAVEQYAKSGLMARTSLDIESAMVLINVFADGTVAFARRSASGQEIVETKVRTNGFPIRLKLEAKNGTLLAAWKDKSSDWQALGEATLPFNTVGFATVSHHLNQIARATISKFDLNTKTKRPHD